MNLAKLKEMAVHSLVEQHVVRIRSAKNLEEIAHVAMEFRDNLADVMEFGREPPQPPEAAKGIKMS